LGRKERQNKPENATCKKELPFRFRRREKNEKSFIGGAVGGSSLLKEQENPSYKVLSPEKGNLVARAEKSGKEKDPS